MAHHLLPTIDRDWITQCTNIFLIRNPREMLTSLLHAIPDPTIEETGLPEQLALFQNICNETEEVPIVLESKDVLQNPSSMLEQVCSKLSIPFYEEMLAWPSGTRKSDGIWAPHWYASVEKSTEFSPWKEKDEQVPPAFETMCLECVDIYEQLAAHKLKPEGREHAPNI